MNGPVEEGFLAQESSYSCTIVLQPPCHKGRSVTQFLAKHEIETLPWPRSILKPEVKKETIANKSR